MDNNTKHIHYIQHVPFEGLGYIEAWVKENGYHLSSTKMYENYTFPETDDFDMLIIMGGPMGVYEEDLYPWLNDEKAFVKKAIEADKIVVGICLGSQMIASALGADVYRGKNKEIGWLPITFKNEDARFLFDSFERTTIVFQWHGDTFDLPEGAKLLASSVGCVNQAFIYNEKVLGLQFHMEVNEKSCFGMLDNGSDELVNGKYIQTEEYIRNNIQYIPKCNKMIKSALDKLIRKI